jgi:hypothetical protein
MQVRVCHSSLLLLFVGLFLSGIVVAPAHAQSAPQISSISPTLGGVGAAAYVYGSNFGSTQGTSTVTFNGTAGTPSYWSNTQINVPVPSGATTGPVVVTVNGAASNGVTFTVTGPVITGLSTYSGVVGASITLTGTNFGASQGSSTVSFNGLPAMPT